MYLLVGLFLSSILSVFAQDIRLSPETVVSQDQLRKIQELLPKLENDRRFIHWTNRATGMRWLSQRHINSGEVSFYNKPTGDRQVYGPGIYLAEQPTSSKSFGEIPVSFVVEKGAPIYDEVIIEKVLGKKLSAAEASVLGQHIPYLRHAANDWYVVNHPEHADKLIYGKKIHPEAKVYVQHADNWNQFKNFQDFQELIKNGDQDAVYLRNIIDASDYMDGISFARAMKINPGAPWNEFEPDNFWKYQNAMVEMSTKREELAARGMDQLEKTLLEVQTTFSGRKDVTSLDQVLRNEGIRAGGDEAGKTFIATTHQLETMKANPYLEVVSTPQGKHHLVHYFYPDVFHFKKLKGKISDELYQKLSSLNQDQLMNDHNLRQQLNKQLLKELVDDFSTRMKAGKANWVELISIHPFEDMNGRTSRMLQELYNNGSNHFLLGDLDILLPVDEQNVYWRKAAKAHQQLQADLIDELLMAKAEGRMPDYMKTTAIQDYLNHGFATPMDIDLNNQENLELIRKRNWVPLMEKGKDLGIARLEQNIKNGKTRARALEVLIDATSGEALSFYSPEEKKQLLKLMHQVLKENADDLESLVPVFRNYKTFYKDADPATKATLTSPTKFQYGMLDKIKRTFRSPTTAQLDLIKTFHQIMAVESDQIRVMNHYLSMVSKSNPKAASDMLHQYLNVQYFMFADESMFASTSAADQKRTLLTAKAHIEKMIEMGDKANAQAAFDKYQELHKISQQSVRDVMPMANDLRTWSKKKGPGKCTLAELLKALN